MPKRVTRRRQSGRYHNFSATRSGAERRGTELGGRIAPMSGRRWGPALR